MNTNGSPDSIQVTTLVPIDVGSSDLKFTDMEAGTNGVFHADDEVATTLRTIPLPSVADGGTFVPAGTTIVLQSTGLGQPIETAFLYQGTIGITGTTGTL